MPSHSTFTHVIVTSPTPQTALAYEIQMRELRASLPCLAGTTVLSVADPAGDRIGSGGGTINAVMQLRKRLGTDALQSCRVLVVHSGGDSRRIPIHSVCGKAWSCLNCDSSSVTSIQSSERVNTATSLIDSVLISSPMALLIAELFAFCKNLPDGSIVVTSSDVLLDLCCVQGSAAGDVAPVFAADSVTLVGIPEVLATAKNHGILIPDDGDAVVPASESQGCSINGTGKGRFVSTTCKGYMQKPSLDEIAQSGASFRGSGPFAAETFAWIDSGVVVFAGSAFQAVCSMLHHPMIAAMCDDQEGRTSMVGSEPRLRLELYSDMLLACSMNKVSRAKSDYFRSLGYSSSSLISTQMDAALSLLIDQFGSIPLNCILVEQAIFCHLGTVSELLDMCLSCCDASDTTNDMSYARYKHKSLCAKYGLRQSAASIIESESDAPELHSSCVVNSFLEGSGSVHSGSLIEHSALIGSYDIGHRCIVSHVDAIFGKDLSLGDDQVLQLLSLLGASSTGNQSSSCVVLMHFGVSDDVKASYLSAKATMLGISWADILNMHNIDPSDVWPDAPSANPECLCLWNAQLFPVINKAHTTNGSYEFVLLDRSGAELTRDIDVIRRVCMLFGSSSSKDSIANDHHLHHLWKQSRRVSMAEILKYGNSFDVMNWRKYLHCWIACGDSSSVVRSLTAASRTEILMNNWGYIKSGLSDFANKLGLLLRTIDGNQSISVAQINLVSSAYLVAFATWCVLLPVQNISEVVESICSNLVETLVKTLFPGCSVGTDSEASLYQILYSVWKRIPVSSKYYIIMFLKSSVGMLDSSVLEVLIREGLMNIVSHLPESSHSRIPLILSYLYPRGIISESATRACLSRIEASDEAGLNMSTMKRCGLDVLQIVMEDILDESNQSAPGGFSLEDISQRIVSFQIKYSLTEQKMSMQSGPSGRVPVDVYESFAANETILVTAPVRIDVIGGWSDTPPICYESGGAVVNVAVAVDGVRPMSCAARFIGAPVVILRSVPYKMISSLRMNASPDLIANNEEEIHNCDVIEISLDDLATMRGHVNPTSKCALLKACIVLLIDDVIAALSQGGGIEVACCSALPAGSGMGGSSVLASVVIQALAALLERECTADDLVYLVSQVEQILTTGGGWQDQIGGIFGGFKIGFSNQGLPLKVRVHSLEFRNQSLKRAVAAAFEERVSLIFTGKQRLAKNTLINALYKCALTPTLHYDTFAAMRSVISKRFNAQAEVDFNGGTVFYLIHEAIKCASALENIRTSPVDSAGKLTPEDVAHQVIDQFAVSITTYWGLKRDMAAGSEPEYLRSLRLHMADVCSGFSVCGAGGGGYAVAVTKRGLKGDIVKAKIADLNIINASKGNNLPICTVHRASIDFEGIRVVTKVCDRTSSILEAML